MFFRAFPVNFATLLSFFTLSSAGCMTGAADLDTSETDASSEAGVDLVGQSLEQTDYKRTVILIRGETQSGQDMFVRGGLDHGIAKSRMGIDCADADGTPNYRCAIPIRHRNLRNMTTSAWKGYDTLLDWYGKEANQNGWSNNIQANGSAADWTTNAWPASGGQVRKVTVDGYGVEPLNTFGAHYWMVDVDMDCSRAYRAADGTRWFELKSFISNGPGWESDVRQSGTPYPSNNHFAQCGKLNVFERGSNSVQFLPLDTTVLVPLPAGLRYCEQGEACSTNTARFNICSQGNATCSPSRTTTVEWTMNGKALSGMSLPIITQTPFTSQFVSGPGYLEYAILPVVYDASKLVLGSDLQLALSFYELSPVWGGTTPLSFTGSTRSTAHGTTHFYKHTSYEPGFSHDQIAAKSELIVNQLIAVTGITPDAHTAYLVPTEMASPIGLDGGLYAGDGDIYVNYGNPPWVAANGGLDSTISSTLAHEMTHNVFSEIYSHFTQFSCLNEGLADALPNHLGHVPDSNFGHSMRGEDFANGCTTQTESHDIGNCVFWRAKLAGYFSDEFFRRLFTPQHNFDFDSCNLTLSQTGDSYVVYLSEATDTDMASFVSEIGIPNAGSYVAAKAALGF